MRKSRFTEQEIIGAVKQIEAGDPIKEFSRKYTSICSRNSFYRRHLGRYERLYESNGLACSTFAAVHLDARDR